jgi:uncharacterized LabA/DUF88 family protein
MSKRTVVYIDAANIILAAKNIGFDLNIIRLVQHLKDSLRAELVIYFSGKFSFMMDTFMQLQQQGVELVYKEIYNENSKTKANCDVEITHRITSDIWTNKVDRVVLLSGDGDFAPLLDFAHSRNLLVKVMALDPSSCSVMLKKRAYTRISYLTDLGKLITNEKPPAST